MFCYNKSMEVVLCQCIKKKIGGGGRNAWRHNEGILVCSPQQLLTQRLVHTSAETQRPTVIVKLWPSIIESWQNGGSRSGLSSVSLQASAPPVGEQMPVFQNKTNRHQSSPKTVRRLNTDVISANLPSLFGQWLFRLTLCLALVFHLCLSSVTPAALSRTLFTTK